MERLHPAPPADNLVLESQVEETLQEFAAEGIDQPDLYVLPEDLRHAEGLLNFNELVERAQDENLVEVAKAAEKGKRLETVVAMFCSVLRFDPHRRALQLHEVRPQLRRYMEEHAPFGVHPWRWLVGLGPALAWADAQKACPGTTENEVATQFSMTWPTAPPRVGNVQGLAFELAKTCPVRSHLAERPQVYLDILSILFWHQWIMDTCGEPWFISGKDLGGLVGLKQPQAARYLRVALGEGLLEKTCDLTPEAARRRKEAYSYRFRSDRVLGQDQLTSPPPTTTNGFSVKTRGCRKEGGVLQTSLVVAPEGEHPLVVAPDRREGPTHRKENRTPKPLHPATPWMDPDTRLRHVLRKLEKVSRSGDGWGARCPAHDDETPSLSVAAGKRGILLNCFAGCSTEKVVAALGLRMTDLFWDPPRRQGR